MESDLRNFSSMPRKQRKNESYGKGHETVILSLFYRYTPMLVSTNARPSIAKKNVTMKTSAATAIAVQR